MLEKGAKAPPPLLAQHHVSTAATTPAAAAAAAAAATTTTTSNASRNSVGASTKKVDDRTCCNLCHIKLGAAFLGVVEAFIAVSVLIGASGHVIYKNQNSSVCRNNIFRDCLIFQFNHFNVTLIFDYVVILMMIFILLSVFCLFCGVFTDTSCLILPHIVIQAIFLLFSLGYFFLYAWSYFYDDLMVKQRVFKFQSMFERMWLATLLLILAGLQSYLFSSVIQCSIYLADVEENRRRRESAFERCSERVRIAKENGLWRTTSWGGGFQQYKGQYDKPKKEVKNKGFHVQWNTDVEAANGVKPDRNTSIEMANIEIAEIVPLTPAADDEIKEVNSSKIEKMKRNSSQLEDRRSSTTSSASHRLHQSTHSRGSSESPKKEATKPRLVKKTSSEGAGRLEEDLRRMSKETIGKDKSHHHHKDHVVRVESRNSPLGQKRHATIRLKSFENSSSQAVENRSNQKRHNFSKMKSFDNPADQQYDEVVAFYKDKHHRRRSSDHGNHNRDKMSSRSPEKKEIPIVKKVSITATPTVPYL